MPSDMTSCHLIGVLNQVGIVSGIFTGQCASIALSRQSTWRFVPVITAGIAALQILSAARMKESPVWLAHKAGSPEDSNEERDSSFPTDSDAGKWRTKSWEGILLRPSDAQVPYNRYTRTPARRNSGAI